MALVVNGLQFVKETTLTEGDMTPGSPAPVLILDGPVDGFESINARVGTGNDSFFTLRHNTAWMRFRGTFTSPDELSVDEVLNSSDAGNPLVLGPGEKVIYSSIDEHMVEAYVDFEEGPLTPSVGGTATYHAQTGRFFRTRRIVAFTFTLHINAIGTGSASVISGLPYEAALGTANVCSVRFQSSVTSLTYLAFVIGSGLSSGAFWGIGSAGASMASQNVLQNGSIVEVSGTYFID